MSASQSQPASYSQPSAIAGNAPDHVKQQLGDMPHFFLSHYEPGTRFGDAVTARTAVTEMSIVPKPDEPLKQEARVVFELDVHQDMLNGGGSLHGGCSAFLIDMTTSLALYVLPVSQGKAIKGSVSQSLNMLYHSPAAKGSRLRIICTTMTLGARAVSCRCEIWSKTDHRLVASGTHVKMEPSLARL